MAEFNLSATKLNETQNHDDFIVMCLSLPDVPVEFVHMIEYLRTFDSLDTFVGDIEKIESEGKILLIVVDFYYVTIFNDFPQIQKIYVWNSELENIIYEKKDFSKLAGIFTNERDLVNQLRQDILLTYKNDLPMSMSYLHEIKNEQSLIGLHSNTLMFIWDQVFIYYLVHIPTTDMIKLKEDMREQCRLEYKNYPVELDKINKCFNDCTSDNVLHWYTEDSFAYRLLNKAFRTRNIELICKFQYFIVLLYGKLKELSLQQQTGNSINVFRGQIMNINDLNKLEANVGRLISWNTMMSTTYDRNVACEFVQGAEIAVIFEININNASHHTLKPFADISKFSSKPDEQEVLFFIGAIFLVESFEQQDKSTWIVKISLNNETDEQLEQLRHVFEKQSQDLKCIRKSFMETDDFGMAKRYYRMLTKKTFSLEDIPRNIINLPVSHLLGLLGHHDQAIELYKTLLLEESSYDKPQRIILHIIIGHNYFTSSQYKNALHHYDIALSLLDNTTLLRGEIYNHIGDVWNAMNTFEDALLSYEQALEILKNDGDKSRLADIYRKISDLHNKLGNLDDAFAYEQQANEINPLSESISTSHDQRLLQHQYELATRNDLSSLERARLLYTIGLCLIKNGDYTQALDKLLEAEQLFISQQPPCIHLVHTFATLYENISLVYLFLNNKLKALTMWRKAINIRATVPWY